MPNRIDKIILDKPDVNLPNVDNTSDVNKPISTAQAAALAAKVDKTTTVNGRALSGNISITATDIGLGNVNNTSDANKPVSTAQATAIAAKVDKTTTVNGKALSGNISITANDVGLGNVNNTSDANKPVSTAQATALAAKVDKTTTINTKPLSGNVILSAGDVGALAISGGTLTGPLNSDSEIRTSNVLVGVGGVATKGDISIDASAGRRHIAFNVVGTSDIMHIYGDPGERVFKISAPLQLLNGYYGVHVTSPLSGEGNSGFRCTPQPMGWTDWRTAAPGLQIDCPMSNNSAYTIWRASHWGKYHLAMMAVHAPGGDVNQTVVNMSLGGFNNQFSFQTNGNAAATGTWVSGSDARFKEDIRQVNSTNGYWTEKVLGIKASNYKYISDVSHTTRLGFIAQEVLPNIPEAVITASTVDDEGNTVDRLHLDPLALIAANYGAFAELHEEVVRLRALVEELLKNK